MALDPKKIGEAITHLRKQAGFTQKGLADRLFISDKAVSKWERGLSVPDIAYLGKLSVLLDTDIDTLLEGKHESRDDRWKGFLVTENFGSDISLSSMIYDKPLVYFLLSNFLLVGIQEVLIACTKEEEMQIRSRIGTGKDLGIVLRYTERTENMNLSQIIHKNQMFFQSCRVMTVFGNTIMYSVSLTYLFQRAMLNSGQHTVIAVPIVNSSDLVPITFDQLKRVTTSDTVHTQYEYCCMPIMFSSGDLLIQDISGDVSPAELVDMLAQQEKLFAEKGSRGIVVANITSLDDAMDASTMIRLLQKHTGANIACLEEIAWRRGFIDVEQLKKLGETQPNSSYGKYVLNLLCK